VSSSESIRTAVRQVRTIADRLDVLINNAGVYPDEGLTVLTVPREQLAQTFQTNTFGPLEVTQAFLPHLRKSDGARLINVSSSYGQLGGLSAGRAKLLSVEAGAQRLGQDAGRSAAGGSHRRQLGRSGWVRTDMGGASATLSVEDGADTVVWLADEAPHDLTGKFFRNRREISW
jgi:NAD(P)-dependent dehydrogenase (short-subunit alcohol dehydrogenase family)